MKGRQPNAVRRQAVDQGAHPSGGFTRAGPVVSALQHPGNQELAKQRLAGEPGFQGSSQAGFRLPAQELPEWKSGFPGGWPRCKCIILQAGSLAYNPQRGNDMTEPVQIKRFNLYLESGPRWRKTMVHGVGKWNRGANQPPY